MKKSKIGAILLSFLITLNLSVWTNAATPKNSSPKTKVVSKTTKTTKPAKKAKPANNAKSTVTVDVYSVLAKANVANSDFTQDVTINSGDLGNVNQRLTSKYSKASDSCIVTSSTNGQTNTVYLNYMHDPAKAEMYVYNATTKSYQKTDDSQVKMVTSNQFSNKFIAFSDSSLKLIVKNSTISGSNNNIKIQTKLTKTILNKLMKDIVAANPRAASVEITDMQYTIIVKNGRITQLDEIQKVKLGGEIVTIKTMYKIGYSKQNIKPFKVK